MSMSVDFTTGTLRLDLDCLPSRFESLTQGKGRINIPKDSLVYFRQEPGRKKKFLVIISCKLILRNMTNTIFLGFNASRKSSSIYLTRQIMVLYTYNKSSTTTT